jgi:flavin-dependent dehydrogenase
MMRRAAGGRSRVKTEECAVLVVGAGPAGAAAGITLARAGIDVCVVDRARFPRPKTCGDAISNSAVALLDGLGLGPALQGAPRARVDGAAVVFPDGSRVRRSYAAAPGMIIRRADLDLLLRDRLLASGARLVEGAAVRELTAHDGRVTARLGTRGAGARAR